MAGWKSTDPEKALESLKAALDYKHDLACLDRIAREAPLEEIRKTAAEYRAELAGYVARAEERDPKCPRCGAPLVEVPYYTAVQGASTVSNVKTEWTASGKRTTYLRNTPYSDLTLHTDTFCPRCASKRFKRHYDLCLFLFLGGLLAALVFGVLLIVRLANAASTGRQGLVAAIGLGAGILACWLGFKIMALKQGVTTWASDKAAPITAEEYHARERGVAFYGPMKYFAASSYDLSFQYIHDRTLARAPHEETANAILTPAFVKQAQEENA